MSVPAPAERRRFRRLKAPILVRPAGRVGAGKLLRQVGDIGLGGLRSFADEEPALGSRVELELLIAGGEPAHVVAEVAWVQALPPGAAARFDVGLKFLQISAEDLARIEAVAVPED